MSTEYTPLRTSIKTLKYDHKRYCDIESEAASKAASTTVLIGAKPLEIESEEANIPSQSKAIRVASVVFFILSAYYVVSYVVTKRNEIISPGDLEGAAWSAVAQPYSTLNPESLGIIGIQRPTVSMPGPIFGDLLNKRVPLPTNSWAENLFLGTKTTGPTNKVYQLPYILDTDTHGGTRQGVDTHPAHVQANDRSVMVRYILINDLYLSY